MLGHATGGQLRDTGPATAVTRLREAGVVASVTPYATPYLRFGTSIATDPEDVERAVKAVRGRSPSGARGAAVPPG